MTDAGALYLTPGEFAKRTGINPKTLWRYAKEGKVKVLMTIGGHRRYPVEEVERIRELMEGVSADDAANRRDV